MSDGAPEGREGEAGASSGGASALRAVPARPDRRMLEALVCPLTHAALSYDAARGELVSRAAHLAFPIREGIPVMLLDEARKLD